MLKAFQVIWGCGGCLGSIGLVNELLISRTCATEREGREESGFPVNSILRIVLTCIARSMSGWESVGKKEVSSMAVGERSISCLWLLA